MEARRQLDGINVLKGIACIIVVFLHIPFPDPVRKLIAFSMNFSVPVFFMISGYFSYDKKEVNYFFSKAIYLLKMIIIFELIYGVHYFVLNCVMHGMDINEFISSIALFEKPIRTIVYGTVFNGTLWYLYAALKSWLIYAALVKFNLLSKRKIYLLIPILSLVHVILRNVANQYNPSDLIFLFRSALLYGLPMMLMGSFIRKNEEKILSLFTKAKSLILVLSGLVLEVLEYVLSKIIFEKTGSDFHISTVIVSFGLFVYFLHFSTIKKSSVILYVGKNLYMWVYLTHILCGSIILESATALHISDSLIYSWIQPLLVLGLSCLCGIVINTIKRGFVHKQG